MLTEYIVTARRYFESKYCKYNAPRLWYGCAVLRGSRSYELSLSKSHADGLLCNFCVSIYGHEKKQMLEFFFASSSPYSCTVKKNMQRHGSFIHFALLKLTVSGL